MGRPGGQGGVGVCLLSSPYSSQIVSKVPILTWNGMGLEGDHETFSVQNIGSVVNRSNFPFCTFVLVCFPSDPCGISLSVNFQLRLPLTHPSNPFILHYSFLDSTYGLKAAFGCLSVFNNQDVCTSVSSLIVSSVQGRSLTVELHDDAIWEQRK